MELLTFASVNGPQVTIHYNILNKGVNIINFNDIIELAYYKVNIDASNYNIEDNYKNIDIKKLFYNHIIFNFCELLKRKQNFYKNIIYYNTQSKFTYSVGKDFITTCNYIVKNIIKIMPVVFIKDIYNFNTFIQKIQQHDADCYSILDKHIEKVQSYDVTNIRLNKLKNFLTKNKLSFLSDSYFKTVQSKLSLVV